MDGRTDLRTFRALLSDEGQSLLAALENAGPGRASRCAATADLWQSSPALVAAAEEQVRLRGRAAAYFGEFGPHMYFPPDLVELSSHLAVAEYKLDRVLHEIGVVLIDAMGLGSGADALVLSRSHHTTGVDADPPAVEIADANARAMRSPMLFPHHEDVTSYDSRSEAVFIDLMRRPGPDGSHDPESYGPSLSWALERVRTTGGGWIRLAPGLGPGVVPDPGRPDEAEWISYDGVSQELVLWWGLGEWGREAAVTVRKATLLPAGASLTARGLPEPVRASPGPLRVRAGPGRGRRGSGGRGRRGCRRWTPPRWRRPPHGRRAAVHALRDGVRGHGGAAVGRCREAADRRPRRAGGVRRHRGGRHRDADRRTRPVPAGALRAS
ncbi:hypothetical protein [Streptomyces sp. TE12347]